MADFVGQNLVMRPHRRFRASHRPVRGHDAVVDGGRPAHVAGIEGECGSVAAIGRVHHPNVQVHRRIPLHHLLQGKVAAVVGQVGLDAVDARGRLPVGVKIRQPKHHAHVGHKPFKIGVHVDQFGVGGREVFVELHDGLVDLGIRDVLGAVVVHHVKHNGDEDVLARAQGGSGTAEGLERFALLALHPHPLGVFTMHFLKLGLVHTLRPGGILNREQGKQGKGKQTSHQVDLGKPQDTMLSFARRAIPTHVL